MRNILGLGITVIAALGIYTQSPAYAVDPATPDAADPLNSEVKVECVDPHACCAESAKVIETLEKLVHAINNGDWKTYESMLDEHCSTFDENSKKLIAGKDNVVADMKSKVDKYAHEGHPFVSVTIDQPYAKVTGDTAVVNFVAIRHYGGKHPFKEECKATDIFIKEGDSWKKCHFRGAWKKA